MIRAHVNTRAEDTILGWGRFLLLGDLGQQLDLRDQQRSLDAVRGAIDGQHRRDTRQEQQIDAIWEEHTEVKMIITRLVQLLVSKGVVSREEVETLVSELEQAERGPPPPR